MEYPNVKHCVYNMIAATQSENRKSCINRQLLASRWDIGLDTANKAMQATT